MPYQVEGVATAISQGRLLLADEQGLGKTLQAIETLRTAPGWLPAVVVCPGVAKDHWEHELRVQGGFLVAVANGTKPPQGPPSPHPQVWVVNYDILRHWVPWFAKHHPPGAVVLDECQYLMTRGRKRTKAAQTLVKGAAHVLAMSGTPLLNKPSELWPVLAMVRPDVWGSWRGYADRYCAPRLTPWGMNYSGASHLPELHERLVVTGTMLRRLKRDVLVLPPKRRVVVGAQLSDPAEYELAEKNFLTWMARRYGRGKASRAAKAEAVVQLGHLKQLVARLKAKAMVQWANDYTAQGAQLVVFCHHRAMVDVLRRRLRGPVVVVDGATARADRQAAIQAFQRGAARVLVGTQAAITAITLTAAQGLAFFELWWRPGDHAQAEDRIHRIGQAAEATIYYHVACGTIEDKILDKIRKKQGVLDTVLEGKVGPTGGGRAANVFDDLLREFAKEAHNGKA
jgi:SWI/SNF-related matrix-associated actin-dependent regulator of chromatin subfamily A-like protein 1